MAVGSAPAGGDHAVLADTQRDESPDPRCKTGLVALGLLFRFAGLPTTGRELVVLARVHRSLLVPIVDWVKWRRDARQLIWELARESSRSCIEGAALQCLGSALGHLDMYVRVPAGLSSSRIVAAALALTSLQARATEECVEHVRARVATVLSLRAVHTAQVVLLNHWGRLLQGERL